MRIKIIAALAAAVCALTVAGQMLYGNLNKKANAIPTNTSTAIATLGAEYVLKMYDGNLAVFINGASEPAEVFSVPVSLLPEADRILLEKGIAASSRAELQRLIEDYTG